MTEIIAALVISALLNVLALVVLAALVLTRRGR